MSVDEWGQSPEIFRLQSVLPVRFCQNLLNHQGVTVHQAHLKQVHGKNSYLLLFPVVGSNLAAAAVEDEGVGAVPILNDV
jgi:hypothetical protein